MPSNIYNGAFTTNVEVEDGFDFWSELANDEPGTPVTEDSCLLTQEPLGLNHITMPCGHKYNYVAICKEISNMKAPKTYYYNTGIKLARNQTFCPYCRKIFDQLLPKIPWSNFVPAKNVCSSTNYIDHRICQYVFQTGKRKGQCCGKKNAFDTKNGAFCSQHACSKKKSANNNTTTFEDEDEDKRKKIWKKFKVRELKDLLRTNSLPVSGTKAVLIARLLKSNVELGLSDM